MDGARLPLPRALRRRGGGRRGLSLRARLPDHRRAAHQPPPVPAPRGIRRGHHPRHEPPLRVRLPARQPGHGARPARPARPLLRDRRRGGQHPHRRGANAADHQRPGRGVGRPVLPVRAARAAPAGPAGGRGGGRRLLRRPQGPRGLADGGGDLEDRAVARRQEPLRRPPADPLLRRRAEGPRALQARPRLHRAGRRDRHRRRVHRPPDARPALERGHPPGDGGEGGAPRPARVGDPRDRDLPELLPPLLEARGHDRHRDDRGRGVPQDLQARGRLDPDQHADDPRRRAGPRLPQRAGQAQGPDRRDRRDAGGGPPGPGRHRQRREVGDPVRAPLAPRHQARGAQRQVPREGGADRRPGRPLGRGDHRDEHGRARDGHPARRQPRRDGLGDPPSARAQPGRGGQGDVRRGVRRGEGGLRRRPRPRGGRRRACTSSGPSATTRAGSTTSSAAAQAGRAIPARRASTSRSKTTS